MTFQFKLKQKDLLINQREWYMSKTIESGSLGLGC